MKINYYIYCEAASHLGVALQFIGKAAGFVCDLVSPVEYIHSFGHKKYKKRDLSRTRELLDLLGSPDRELKFVHIAGTNGKGSVSAMLDSVLRTAGYRVGLFTSPYITCFNERIRFNGQDIETEELSEIVEKLKPVIDALDEKPTEFELVTVIGLLYFQKKKCDIVVFEAGMGGRYDFTNVIEATEAAVITSIGEEHLNVLGPGLSDVALHKSGIIKRGCELVFAGVPDEAKNVIISEAKALGVPYYEIDSRDIENPRYLPDRTSFIYKDVGGITIPLAGVFQPANASLAIETCIVLRRRGWIIPQYAVTEGLKSVTWKGRMEKLSEKPLFFLDGAHNPPAAKAAAESLRAILGDKKVTFVIGAMADKDIPGIFSELEPLASSFKCVPIDYERAVRPSALADMIGEKATAYERVRDGVSAAISEAGQDGAVCALGSLYLGESVRNAIIDLMRGVKL